jgi:3-dehydroquinate synthase
VTRRIDVELGDESYAVSVEPGLLARVGDAVAAVAPHARAVLVEDANVVEPHGDTAATALAGAGFEVVRLTIVADEASKTLATVARLYDAMAAAGVERGTPVVALGGGVTGDVAGFAAATFLRGVPLVHVPTTLLAMVDASIGGKTGVNLAVDGGAVLAKNLVGAFWQPRAVLADPETLRTLPDRELRCGLAECVKHGLVGDAGLLDALAAGADRVLGLDPAALVELVARSAAVKAAVVREDVREAGRRAELNLGHTFAHAIESMHELDVRHGEAVAIGLCAAAHCAEATGRRPPLAEVRDLLTRLGLPTALPRLVPGRRLVERMRYDKKIAGGRRRLVLPVGRGRAEVADDVPDAVVEAAWRAVGADADDAA